MQAAQPMRRASRSLCRERLRVEHFTRLTTRTDGIANRVFRAVLAVDDRLLFVAVIEPAGPQEQVDSVFIAAAPDISFLPAYGFARH